MSRTSRQWQLGTRLAGGLIGVTALLGAASAQPGVVYRGGVAIYTVPPALMQKGLDYAHARPMPLPQGAYSSEQSKQDLAQAILSPTTPANGTPTVSPGSSGDGVQHPVLIPAPVLGRPVKGQAGVVHAAVVPLDYGSQNYPFDTARADLQTLATNTNYPYRAAGILFFQTPSGAFHCSGSLIKRGVVLTAAHCIGLYGSNNFYSNFQFVPGYRNGGSGQSAVGRYGNWSYQSVTVLQSYLDGSGSCTQSAIICQDDVGLVVLAPQTNSRGLSYYPGTNTGWFAYGINGWGFTGHATQITELGYPNNLDNAVDMERNDAQGVSTPGMSNNTILGSLMNDGSDGGPWLMNFGLPAGLTQGSKAGSASTPNVVVGATSWGYNDNPSSTGHKAQGASALTSANIGTLISNACASFPDACS